MGKTVAITCRRCVADCRNDTVRITHERPGASVNQAENGIGSYVDISYDRKTSAGGS